MQPTSAEAEVPMVERGNAQVVAVMGGQLQIMDVATYETFNVAKPTELKDLKSGDEIEYLRAETQFRILRKKNA
jgi:translation initiation factor 5A